MRRSRAFLWLAAASGVTGQLLFSNDWCLYTVPAALLALMAYGLAAAWVSSIAALDRGVVRLLLAIGLGLASGAVFRVSPGWAFQEAFGAAPPAGIRDLHIWRHYEGGPGEHSLIFEFTADARAMQALIARFPHEPDRPRNFPEAASATAAWDERHEWAAAYDLYGGYGHPNGRRTWEHLTPLRAPRVFFRAGTMDNDAKLLLMLWEESTGRVVVLHSRG